jgi:hypothetical protein
VKKIKGCQLDGGHDVSKLSFSKKDGSELAKVEVGNNGKPYGPESLLTDDEEIIGMFGTKDWANSRFDQLGFIVWKPPKF